MPLRVSFELGDADLQHLAEVAQERQSAARSQPVAGIVAAAREVFMKGSQSQLADFVRDAEQAVTDALPDCISVSYGHVGDGNVHLNVLPPAGLSADERRARIYAAKNVVNVVVDRYDGSMSAEHGIGRLKRADFEARLPETRRALLTAVKHAIDPSLTMNPGCQLKFSENS